MSIQAYSFRRSLIGWTLTAILAFVASTASAAVLHEQSPVNGGIGYYANPNFPQQMADDFNPGGAATLERITWWGGYGGNIDNNGDDFLVRIYSGVSGTGAVMQEFGSAAFARTATTLADNANNDVYQYDFDLSTSLASGVYYLSVQNLGTSDWFWLQSGTGNGNLVYRGDDTDNWIAWNVDLALRLEGTPAQIPEPSSLALLGIASLSMAMVAWRRQRRVIWFGSAV